MFRYLMYYFLSPDVICFCCASPLSALVSVDNYLVIPHSKTLLASIYISSIVESSSTVATLIAAASLIAVVVEATPNAEGAAHLEKDISAGWNSVCGSATA